MNNETIKYDLCPENYKAIISLVQQKEWQLRREDGVTQSYAYYKAREIVADELISSWPPDITPDGKGLGSWLGKMSRSLQEAKMKNGQASIDPIFTETKPPIPVAEEAGDTQFVTGKPIVRAAQRRATFMDKIRAQISDMKPGETRLACFKDRKVALGVQSTTSTVMGLLWPRGDKPKNPWATHLIPDGDVYILQITRFEE